MQNLRLTLLLFAHGEDIYGRHCVKKSNNDYFHPYVVIVVFNKKRCSFSVVKNNQTRWRFLVLEKKISLVCPLRNNVTSLLSASVLKRVQRRRATWIRCIFEPNWYVRGYIFYGLTRMLMRKNVNNDVTIIPPIPGIYSNREIPVPVQGHRWLYSAFINFLDLLRGLNCL